ncbi:class IV adenylate cyclase [Candidatus Aerophobetes bacterium]|uniref:Class IV adenylate cyclase n=1 Tax=Aerophobetes bacterium TaxID=2030807 RepID=A0A662DI60_UNCAE|nr:MAG: class IV adenylate cyclase [Candidatus Aerophobetes bacterium]
MLEVELKARVDQEYIRKKLLKEGVKPVKKEKQVDTYFNHPCHDFKSKDEALRVRQAEGRLYLTFKGPRVDTETKTREELEVEVKGDIFALLEALGFVPSKKIIKERETYRWEGLKLFLDKVEGLGSFLEIEGKEVNEKGKIFHLFNKLGIHSDRFIKKSYLELIMEEGGEK